MSNHPPLYKADEAARFLEVTPQKLGAMRRTGELPEPVTIGDEQRSFGHGLKETTGWHLPVLKEVKRRFEAA